MKKRDLNLSKYNISKYRYRELYNFCLQYREREREIAEYRNPSRNPPSGLPNGSGLSDPTASAGINAALLVEQNEMIRQSAKEASGDLYRWFLPAIVDGLTYNTVRMQDNIPCGRNMFQRMRHEFFFLLDQKQKK